MNKIDLLIIIPARISSKGIKEKNIRKINKHPLIAYSIEAAKRFKSKSKLIHCSTESEKIRNICKKYGLKVNFLRPKNISKDSSRDLDFVNHTLLKFYKEEKLFKFGLILRPTSPVRTIQTLERAYKVFKKNKLMDSMRAITPSYSSPYKTWFIKKNLLSPVIKSKLF